MKDYYLKTNDKEAVLGQLGVESIENYYQNENLIVDWIGEIPESTGDHFNVRTLTEEGESIIDSLTDAENILPNTPYRIFG